MMGVCSKAQGKVIQRLSWLLGRGTSGFSMLLLCGFSLGCEAKEVIAPSLPDAAFEEKRDVLPPALPTHRLIQAPPQVGLSGARLWVALEDHLGQGTTKTHSGKVLKLTSAGQPMRLVDGNGKEYQGTDLVISWRLAPLAAPVSLARDIAGPYASFESAERVAIAWRRLGVTAVVAHPGDWQVWAPFGSKTPEGLATTSWQTTVESSVQPVLQAADGGHTLKGPVLIDSPDGLRWKGGVYRGPFRLQPDAYGSWTLVEQVPLERYLEGVVPHEIGSGAPGAALAAQAVLARTWALANKHRFEIDGYHLCSDTQCQVYSDPRQASQNVRQAIQATSGNVLTWQGVPINAVYHASNGGVMADGTEAWSMAPVSYLKARIDGSPSWNESFALPLNTSSAVAMLLDEESGLHGTEHPRFRWTRRLADAELVQAIRPLSANVSPPLRVTVVERGRSGRVLSLEIAGSGAEDQPVTLTLDGIRRRLRQLPSTLFVLNELNPGVWEFNGGGFGHGAGLSQAGAIDLAQQGWTTDRILSHYYPGTTLERLSFPERSP